MFRRYLTSSLMLIEVLLAHPKFDPLKPEDVPVKLTVDPDILLSRTNDLQNFTHVFNFSFVARGNMRNPICLQISQPS